MTNLTNNKAVLSWIDEMTAITKPDKIVWITGEEEQLGALREQAVKEGILIKLNPDKLPGCYLHRTDPDDVARVEDRTFICCEKEEDAGPTNHWVSPRKCTKECTLWPTAPIRAAPCTSSRTPCPSSARRSPNTALN